MIKQFIKMKFILLTVFGIVVWGISPAQVTKKPVPVVRKTVTTEQLKIQINDAYSKGYFAKTIVLCNQLLTRTPSDTDNAVTMILCKTKLKKDKEAIEDIKKFYKENSAEFLALFPAEIFAAEFNERMSFDEREQYYSASILLNPGNARVYFKQAYDYYDDDNCIKAIELAQKGYSLITKETVSYIRSYIYLQKKCGNRDTAWSVLNAYINRYPDDLNAKGMKATFLTEDRKFEEALVYINEAIAVEPGNKDFYMARASVYFKMNDKAAACKEAKFIKEKFNDATAEIEFKCLD
jgi:tetratricopeptide (TPR) repeat protein